MKVVLAVALAAAILTALSPTGASAATVVGRVTSVSGAGRLSVDPAGPRGPVALEAGDRLRLGDVVIVGRGTKAVLTLMRPAGSADPELIHVRGAAGARPLVTLRRQAARVTVVTISA